MDWLNLHSSVLDSPEFVGAEPVDRATWLCLLRYCAGQENGGKIADCSEWGDRKWQQLARVTKAEVSRKSDLWRWDGPVLIVWSYPSDKEDDVKRLRKQSKAASKARWGKRPGHSNGELPSRPNPRGTMTPPAP